MEVVASPGPGLFLGFTVSLDFMTGNCPGGRSSPPLAFSCRAHMNDLTPETFLFESTTPQSDRPSCKYPVPALPVREKRIPFKCGVSLSPEEAGNHQL